MSEDFILTGEDFYHFALEIKSLFPHLQYDKYLGGINKIFCFISDILHSIFCFKF